MSYTTDVFGNRITDLTINLDAPPLDPAGTDGGTGSVSLRTTDTENFHMWAGRELWVNNSLPTTISSVSVSDEESSSVAAELCLYRTNVHRTVRPRYGVLGEHLAYLGSLVGLTFSLPIHPTPIYLYALPGYEGNLWTFIKQFLSAHNLEPYDYSLANRVLFRPVRSGGTLRGHVTSTSKSLDDSNLAKFVDVNYYNHKNVTSGQVYPLPGVEEVPEQIFTVEAGKTTEVDIQLSAWLRAVNQAYPVDFVDATTDWSGTNGRYSITGADGAPVPAAAWVGEGGRLSLELTDDPSVVRMRLVGPRVSAWSESIGPFSVAATGVGGVMFSTLRITGDGTTFNQKTVRIATGAGGPLASEDVGATVDNPNISTREQAFDLGVRTAQAYGGAQYTLDNTYGPHDGVTYDQPGKRIDGDRVKFRVRSASISQGGVSVSAEADTTFADFNSVYTGRTFADFNAANTGMTFDQWAAVPLNV